jgi:hypothetical protein
VVGDGDLERGLLSVSRKTYPGRGGLVDKLTWRVVGVVVELHLLHRVAGTSPAVTACHLHPDHAAVLEAAGRFRRGGLGKLDHPVGSLDRQ